MRVLHLYAENILNLRAVAITPSGRVTRITGKNGAGKSNVLNAMFYALAGKKGHASQPIRRGEQRAAVRLDLGDEQVELSVILRITEKAAYLDVESPEGARFKSPQDMLKALFGQLTFDPHAFSRMPAPQRLEVLRGIVKPAVDVDALDRLNERVDVDALDRLNERDRQLRTDFNRLAKSRYERVTLLHEQLDETMSVAPVDISELTQQMVFAQEHNSAVTRAAMEQRAAVRELDDLKRERARIVDAIADLQEQLATTDDRIGRVTTALDEADPIPTLMDVSALRDQINQAGAENAKRAAQARVRDDFERARAEAEAASAKSAELTAAMEARTQAKEDAIAATPMPIAGLGFGEGDVTFNGLPFDQASTGEQLRIATAIGMALNPKLRVLCVRDGSLLDSESSAILEEMAEQHDFQLWVEATQDAPTTGIHIVDGSVAAIDGVPVTDETLAEVGD